MYAGLDLLRPLLLRDHVPMLGKVVIGTIRGDLHDIGKNLVGIMLQGAGFEVIDLGKDVPPARFVETAIEQEAPVIGMSALLTTTMVGMKEVVEILRARRCQGKIKTIVGGAPVSADFAREIGANDYAFDAASAVTHIKALLGVA
jgi:5-methyltetrahydrofolate--homocysteine methyltransferase